MTDIYGMPLRNNAVPKELIMTIPAKNDREARNIRACIAELLKDFGIHKKIYKTEIRRIDEKV